jgi:UDP-N-acetylmuramate dehydrogenase
MRWETDVALAEHTRYRIGGTTPRFGRPETRPALANALKDAKPGTVRVLGWGANVLVSDAGVTEPVIVLGGDFAHMNLGDRWIDAGAAAGLPTLVGEARRSGRSDWSFLEAVPGSVGGGLRMNAGSTDTGLWNRVQWAEAMTAGGETVRLTPVDAHPTYRSVSVAESWVFLGARFDAVPGDPAEIDQQHFERRRMKVETQVYDLPSCGSTWKNPGEPWGSAWSLVDRVGMRGARRGGAQITERHANFIANLGHATASDVWWLMAETRRRVKEDFGADLEPEIRLWGFTRDELAAIGGVE